MATHATTTLEIPNDRKLFNYCVYTSFAYLCLTMHADSCTANLFFPTASPRLLESDLLLALTLSEPSEMARQYPDIDACFHGPLLRFISILEQL